jgi:hypothetical protein
VITPVRHTKLLPGTLKNLFYPPEPGEYIYFARAGECAFANGSTLVKAAWAADASMLVYARYGADRMDDGDLDANFGRAGLAYQKIGGSAGNWNASGTQAVFASCDQFAILAFRGTEIDDTEDSLYDADIALVPEHDYRPSPDDPEPALGHLTGITNLFSPPCLVHQGFQKALKEVWEQVHRIFLDYRSSHPRVEIRFTGHSLGGALAVLVAHVPPESLFDQQAPSQCYRFDENGNLSQDGDTFGGDVDSLRAAVNGLPAGLRTVDLDSIPAPPSVVDHSPARYCFRLWDCV